MTRKGQRRRLQGCVAGQTGELMEEAENAKEAEKEDGDWTKEGEERSNLMRGERYTYQHLRKGPPEREAWDGRVDQGSRGQMVLLSLTVTHLHSLTFF
jgi:hypothetical protein